MGKVLSQGARAAALLLAFSIGAPAPALAQMGPTARTFQDYLATPSVLGTVWTGLSIWEGAPANQPSERWTVTFLPGQKLRYQTSDGRVFENGTWRQNGALVLLETNQFFSARLGTIHGDVIHGDARNQRGERGTFRLERLSAEGQVL
jgi:hypothetical protein